MDPVSQILLDRERTPQHMLPFVAIALALHASLAAAVFVATRTPGGRPAQLPAVSVKLVRPTRAPVTQPAQTRRQEPAARTVPETKPTTAPRPTAKPRPPEPAPTAALSTSTSTDAMPAAETRSTPVATAPPAAAASSGPARGLSLGAGEDSGTPGIPADFQFTYYVTRMLTLIESRWYKPPVPAATHARVRFRIQKNGRLDSIQLEESSQIPSFDRAVLRAIYAANPLPPLPPAYPKPSLTVHLTFSE